MDGWNKLESERRPIQTFVFCARLSGHTTIVTRLVLNPRGVPVCVSGVMKRLKYERAKACGQEEEVFLRACSPANPMQFGVGCSGQAPSRKGPLARPYASGVECSTDVQ